MLNAIFRPLKTWPGKRTPAQERERSPFQSTYDKTLDLLEYELNRIYARNIVIQVMLAPNQIRNDGWPKTINAIVDPAVLVTFNDDAGDQYAYPCDTFTDFKSNLRAIALALEALRKVDRYGVTRRGEQYQGFKALPSGEQQQQKMSPEQAAAFLCGIFPGVTPDVLLTAKVWFEMAFKEARKIVHPDVTGGSHEKWVKLQEAGDVLTRHFEAFP